METITSTVAQWTETAIAWFSSPQFYAQLAVIAAAVSLAWIAAALLRTRIPLFRHAPPADGPLHDLKQRLFDARELIFPILCVVALGLAREFGGLLVDQLWLVRAAQGLAVVYLLFSFVTHFVKRPSFVAMVRWIGVPVALLFVLGVLDDVTAYLDGISVEVGNLRLSAFAIVRTLFFGAILFWLGRISKDTGKRVIRSREELDNDTREIAAKLFEVGLYVVIAVLLLQVMGINFTTLAVFGGAIGVGLGFGLQQIAANFISGIIILLDRSIRIGDFIELEDGRSGTLREMTMRSATLETFDGKEIMVPNERFITTAFTNWTHSNKKQRYPIEFQVAYKTDLEKMFEILRKVVASHPKVLSGPDVPIEERPDAEIASFGDSGINILVEFWMEGIDDGENRVGADLLLMIWTALKENGIEIPFPQREVQLLGQEGSSANGRGAAPA